MTEMQKKKEEMNSSSEFDSEEEEEEEEQAVEDDCDSNDENGEICYSSKTTYDPTHEEKKRLAKMSIQLRHTPPLQHEIEKTAGTRTLTKADKKLFEQHTVLKTGTFLAEEDKRIRRNWRIFCKLHNWDFKNPKPFLLMKHKNEELYLMSLKNRKKFVQFLADGLPDRSLYSVYQRFKVMYEPHKVSRYKPEEDNIIINYTKKYGNMQPDRKFADLAKILKRTRASVWRRHRLLQKKHKICES